MFYDISGPVTLSAFNTSKYDKVHAKLFDAALEEYCKSVDMSVSYFRTSYNISEIKRNEYYEPSYIVISPRKRGLKGITRTVIDMTAYWNQGIYKEHNYKDIKEIPDNNLYTDWEVIYIDYVKGLIRLRNKNGGNIIEAPFGSVNGDVKISEEYSLKNTFTYILLNK